MRIVCVPNNLTTRLVEEKSLLKNTSFFQESLLLGALLHCTASCIVSSSNNYEVVFLLTLANPYIAYTDPCFSIFVAYIK